VTNVKQLSKLDAEAQEWAADILDDLVEGGHVDGREFIAGTNPNRDDDTNPGTFKVNTETGMWADFGSTDPKARGCGMTSFVEYRWGISRADAEGKIRDALKAYEGGAAPAKRLPMEPESDALPTATPPAFTLSVDHLKVPRGQITGIHPLIDAQGRTHGAEIRVEGTGANGERVKDCRLASLRNVGGVPTWTWRGPAKPYPLFNLPALLSAPSARVLVLEGYNKVKAITPLLNEKEWVAVAWVGGAGAVEKTDWSPLHGRSVPRLVCTRFPQRSSSEVGIEL